MRSHAIVCCLLVAFLVISVLPAIAAASGALADVPETEEITLDQILERYIKAMGGRAAIETLTTRVCSGQLIDDFPSRTPPVYETATIEASAKAPDKWLLVRQGSNGVHKDGSDGRRGWRQDPNAVDDDERMKRSKLSFLLDPRGPLHLEDYFPAMDLKGRDVVGGREVYVVESERDNAHYTLYFDVETDMLNQIGYYWELQDYREVDGVKFPFRIATSRKGGSSTYVFDDVRHDAVLGDSLFAKPDTVSCNQSP